MRLVDLIEPEATEGQRTPLHELSVDDAVCEILRSLPSTASDAAPLLSCGRSAHQTADPEQQPGVFLPPMDSKLHGSVGLDSGTDAGVLYCEVLCTPDRLMLVGFASVAAYRSLVADSTRRSQVQTALFPDKRRALLYYTTLEKAIPDAHTCSEAPFFLHIPNGMAFLRVCDTSEEQQHPRRLRTSEFTGLFRYYGERSRPSLHFVLQIESEAPPHSPGLSGMAHACNPASLEAMMTFLGNRRPEAPPENHTVASWAGATEDAGTPTPSETATVVAECVQAVAVAPRSSSALRRLKRALE